MKTKILIFTICAIIGYCLPHGKPVKKSVTLTTSTLIVERTTNFCNFGYTFSYNNQDFMRVKRVCQMDHVWTPTNLLVEVTNEPIVTRTNGLWVITFKEKIK